MNVAPYKCPATPTLSSTLNTCSWRPIVADKASLISDLQACAGGTGPNTWEGWSGDCTCCIGWPVGTWDVSLVTDMSGLFSGATSFNADLSGWNTSSVTNMNAMFQYAESFSQDLSDWDVSRVTDMIGLFSFATSFNANLSDWVTSSVTSMAYMFQYAESFSQDLSDWDTSSVTNMEYMFLGALSMTGEPYYCPFNPGSLNQCTWQPPP